MWARRFLASFPAATLFFRPRSFFALLVNSNVFGHTFIQGSYAILKSMENFVIFQSAKNVFGMLVWKKKIIVQT